MIYVMRKLLFALILLVVSTSCSQVILPRAINTVNAVSLDELNLARADYKILNTVNADAVVYYSTSVDGKIVTIQCHEDDFALKYTKTKKGWRSEFKGVAKLGYLANDYAGSNEQMVVPEEVARRLAIYKLINEVKLVGADGVIEPIISTNVENGKSAREVVFKTSVSAKIIKLNTNK